MKRRWKFASIVLIVWIALIFLPDYPAILIPSEPLQALRSADRVTLYSIDPLTTDWMKQNNESSVSSASFYYHYKILGQISLEGEKLHQASHAFQHAVAFPIGLEVMCFDPRHALRVVSQGHTYDFLLCYQCMQMEIYKDEKQMAHLHVWGSPKVLNKILTEANIPLAKVGW